MFDVDPERLPGPEFITTRWNVVLSAGNTEATAAREQFARIYLRPLYVFARREGLGEQDAEDAVQGFLSRLLEGERLTGIDRDGGRFRSYLLAAFRNHLVSFHRHGQAGLRQPGSGFVFLDALEPEYRAMIEPADGRTPEAEYDRACALALLKSVEDRLRREYGGRGEEAMFEHLFRHLADDADAVGHGEAAKRLGRDEGTIRNAMVRFRARFQAVFREHVTATLASGYPDVVESEIRDLHRALGG